MPLSEQQLLRSSNQWTKYYLAIDKPVAVFACRINQAFATGVGVVQIAYDGITAGAYTAVVEGMTIYVGTAAGLYDVGMLRVRKAATSSLLYIGQDNTVQLANDLYLTVVNEFGLWARHWRTIDKSIVKMDYDLDYSDQNEILSPIPILGPDAVLLYDPGTIEAPGSVVFTPTAASSWVIGSTIASYAWTAVGSSATANMATASPTITYNTAGRYIITCRVTAANGRVTTGRRMVYVYSTAAMPASAEISSVTGDLENGGWTFKVTISENGLQSDIRDGAKVILFAVDVYNGEVQSIGQIDGYENIVCAGWIDAETISDVIDLGPITFSIHGPAFWLNNLFTYGCGLANVTEFDVGITTEWRFSTNITIDKLLYNIIYWRSTIAYIMDVYPTGDTRISQGIISPAGTLWSVLKYAGAKIMGRPACDRFGRMFMEIDSQYLALADRTSITTVMAITQPDWEGELSFSRRTMSPIGTVDASGTGSQEDEMYFSRAPGITPGRFGNVHTQDQLLIGSQDQLNMLSGMIYARESNMYPSVDITLSQNNRMLDIVPLQYVSLTVATGDTVRGIEFNAKLFIPRRVEHKYDPKSSSVVTQLELEGATDGPPGVTIIPPQPPMRQPRTYPIYTGGVLSPLPHLQFPRLISVPPKSLDCAGDLGLGHGPYTIFFDPATFAALGVSYCYFPCGVRAGSATNKTRIYLAGNWSDDNPPSFTIEAVDENREVIAGVTSEIVTTGDRVYIDFTPTAATAVSGFKITNTDYSSFNLGGSVDQVDVPATSYSPTTCTNCVDGTWYCASVFRRYGGNTDWWHYTETEGDTSNVIHVLLDGVDSGNAGRQDGSLAHGFEWSGSANVVGAEEHYSIAVGYYSEIFFKAGTLTQFAIVDSNYADNSGGLRVIVSEVTPVAGPDLNIRWSQIYNICEA